MTASWSTIDRYRLTWLPKQGRLLRDSGPLEYMDYPQARTASPLILEVS